MDRTIQKNTKSLPFGISVSYLYKKTVSSACFLIVLFFNLSCANISFYQKKKSFELFPKKESLSKKDQNLQIVEEEKMPSVVTLSLHQARVWMQKKQYQKALSQLRKVRDLEISQSDLLKSFYLEWKILNQQKSADVHDQIWVLSQIVEYSDSLEIQSKATKRVFSLVETLSQSHIQSFIKNPDVSSIKDILLFHLARNLVKKKSYKKALVYFKKILSDPINYQPLEKKTQQYIQALKFRTKVNSYTIGAVLPLTGKYSKIGERCLNGLQLGLGIYDPEPSSFQLVVMDSKGKSHTTKNAVKEIFLKHKAIGIAGGVVSQSATSLAKEAQNFMIPSILLSQKSQLTQMGSFIFQNAITNEQIIQNLVNVLIHQLNHKKFAVLYPNDPFGVEYVNLFWDYVEKSGGKITGVQMYKPNENDFTNAVKRLIGMYYLEDRDEEFREKLTQWLSVSKKKKRNQKSLTDLLPSVVDFSVLFIPDSIASLHRIVPYIAVQGIKGVTLAGPSLWNSPLLLKDKKQFLEGAIFTDALITHHSVFKTSEFAKNFQRVFNYHPGLFEFLSYQSASILKKLILNGASSRSELRDQLLEIEEFTSSIGKVQMNHQRQFVYPIHAFTVKEGQRTRLLSSSNKK